MMGFIGILHGWSTLPSHLLLHRDLIVVRVKWTGLWLDCLMPSCQTTKVETK